MRTIGISSAQAVFRLRKMDLDLLLARRVGRRCPRGLEPASQGLELGNPEPLLGSLQRLLNLVEHSIRQQLVDRRPRLRERRRRRRCVGDLLVQLQGFGRVRLEPERRLGCRQSGGPVSGVDTGPRFLQMRRDRIERRLTLPFQPGGLLPSPVFCLAPLGLRPHPAQEIHRARLLRVELLDLCELRLRRLQIAGRERRLGLSEHLVDRLLALDPGLGFHLPGLDALNDRRNEVRLRVERRGALERPERIVEPRLGECHLRIGEHHGQLPGALHPFGLQAPPAFDLGRLETQSAQRLLDVLMRRLEGLKDRDGRIVILVGEPGLRLLDGGVCAQL